MQTQISTYVDIRATYVVPTYLPLVRNFYPYAEQQPTMGLHRIPLLVCTSSPLHSREKPQASKPKEGYYPPLLYRARWHLSPRRKKRRSRGREYQPIHRDPVTKLYRHSAYTYSKARYAELCSLPKKRQKPSASPLERAGAWRYWDGAEL